MIFSSRPFSLFCVSFFQYALELRVAKDSILFCDTSFTAQALVKLYLDLYEKHAEGILNTSVQLEDVVSTIELLVSDLQECSRLLSIAPQFEKQQVRFLEIPHSGAMGIKGKCK